MSSKPGMSKREGRKMAASEKILTRNKSNQMKRELRNTDKSRKRIIQITKLLRSPSRERDPPVFNRRTTVKEKEKVSKREHTETDSKTVSKETVKKKNNSKKEESRAGKLPDLLMVEKEYKYLVKRAGEEEFHPEKVKRRRRAKKMALKPASGVRIIGNKRKMTIPQKDASSIPSKRARSHSANSTPQNQELHQLATGDKPRTGSPSPESLMDLESLTDEDLFEILTCESPVWWEEGPTEEYTEDPIPYIKTTSKMNDEKAKANNINDGQSRKVKQTDTKQEITQTKVFDDKFLKKRSKLENLLGSIKNKLSNKQENPKTTDRVEQNKDINIDLDNNKIIKQSAASDTVQNIIYDKSEKVDPENMNILIDNSDLDNPSDNKSEIRNNQSEKKDKLISESSESDDVLLHLPFDEMLKTFENIEIPVESHKKHCEDTIIVDDDTSNNINQALLNKTRNFDATEINPDNSLNKEIVNEDIIESLASKEIDFPHKLRITSIQESSSPVSVRSSIISDANDTFNVSNVDNLDTISDTNVKFVDEDYSSGRNSVIEEIVATNEEQSANLNENIAREKDLLAVVEKNTLTKSTEEDRNEIIVMIEEKTVNINENFKGISESDKGLIALAEKSTSRHNEIIEESRKGKISTAEENTQKVKENIDDNKKEAIATVVKKPTKVNENKDENKNVTVDRKTTMFRLKQAYKELCDKKDNALLGKHDNDERCKDDPNVQYKGKTATVSNEKTDVYLKELDDTKLNDQNYSVKTSDPDKDLSVKTIKDNSKEIKIINNETKSYIDQNDGENTKNNSFYKEFSQFICQRRSKYTIVTSCKPNPSTERLEEINKVTKAFKSKTEDILDEDKVKSICNTCEKDKVNSVCKTCTEKNKASILVNDSTVKYCLKCSSIFDTDNCGYCVKKNSNFINLHGKR